MAERPARRSALAAVLHAGDFGTVPASGPGILLSERRGLAMVQLAADDAAYAGAAARIQTTLGLELPRQPNRAVVAGARTALWTGPGRVLLVAAEAERLEEALQQALLGVDVAVTPLSHARSVIRLSGPRVRDLLAKGCGLDFHARAFAPGSAVQSSYAQINVLLVALDEAPSVDLYVARGFAVALWEHLLDGALEYGCRVEG
ncbi:MAG TPA: sarcosine oxidase subunit gamma family protein [Alphaproteobacteria bacterium]|nr:sarcosine oxidase subunit gamma family protein [Alphaproteobacteria bacterium]